MKNRRRAFALYDLIVVFAVVLILAALLLPALAKAREESRKAVCKENLSWFGKAIFTYLTSQAERYPFASRPANERPGQSNGECDAMTSMGNLYPVYLDTARVFRCPSTNDEPRFKTNLPWPFDGKRPEPRDNKTPNVFQWSNRNHTLENSSYGYDPRMASNAKPHHVMAADMDGTWTKNHDTETQNHAVGQNVLYVDGNVKWQTTNSCANDENDNIYAEDPWHADTDSFLVDKDNVDLKKSREGYKDLREER